MKMNLKKTNDFLEGQGTRLKVNLSQFPSFIFPTLELCKCGFFFNVQKKQSNPEKQKNQLKQIIIVHQSGSITTQRKIILGDSILYL